MQRRAAWAALRAGRRWRAVRYYVRGITEGDVRSVGRAAIALLHPAVGSESIVRPAGSRPRLDCGGGTLARGVRGRRSRRTSGPILDPANPLLRPNAPVVLFSQRLSARSSRSPFRSCGAALPSPTTSTTASPHWSSGSAGFMTASWQQLGAIRPARFLEILLTAGVCRSLPFGVAIAVSAAAHARRRLVGPGTPARPRHSRLLGRTLAAPSGCSSRSEPRRDCGPPRFTSHLGWLLALARCGLYRRGQHGWAAACQLWSPRCRSSR